MTPSSLHQLWSLIESAQASFLIALDDAQLVDWLTTQLQERHFLNATDAKIAKDYINSRLLLIRDLVQVETLSIIRNS